MPKGQLDWSNVVIDRENRCIDRSTELGRQLDELNAYIDNLPDPGEREFMSKFVACVEAEIVLSKLCPGEDGKKRVDKLWKTAYPD